MNILLTQISEEGELDWSIIYSNSAWELSHGIIRYSNGGYALTGQTSNGSGGNDFFLFTLQEDYMSCGNYFDQQIQLSVTDISAHSDLIFEEPSYTVSFPFISSLQDTNIFPTFTDASSTVAEVDAN